ncbi:hypothetical protein [Pseudotabrizicola alkalilacus]|uniref:Uncharacterized protein n=1 Tax=Pseudotabrizicola alkalilacus TaxID=2305252 RepID=A0A411Z4E6_9RHOB|nr:hypothetical protein [Pseudotabrizicola alkalilacus]RGP37947.1 hypothetical protein D1012_08675 [Pseudotabrizicola alkalilacus]
MMDKAMLQFHLDKATEQIQQEHEALLHLCRKHGMPEGMDLCMKWLDETLTARQARVTDLEAERAARHANPADFRYWEGRYRDEKARVVDLEAELGGLRDMIQSAEIMTATGEGLDPDETIRLHLMFGAARGDQPVTTERLSKALIDANARLIEQEGLLRRGPVAYRVRLSGDDPEEWQLVPASRAVDFLDRPTFECQPLYLEPGQ